MSSRPAWLKFDAHRRCRARARSVRACRLVGFATRPKRRLRTSPAARQRLLFAVRRFRSIRIPATARPPSKSAPISRPSRPIPARSAPIRRPAARSSFRRSPPSSGSRSQSAPGSTRTRPETSGKSLRPRSRAPQQQRQRHRRRQRDDVPRANMTVDRTDRAHPAREAIEPGPGNDGGNLDGLASIIPNSLRPSTSSPRTSCLIGRACRSTRGRPHPRDLRPTAPAIPGKRIVIAEFGWPSAGYNFQQANPGPHRAGRGVTRFRRARGRLGIDYNIVEAIDQPWKTFEGGVGPYWGMFEPRAQPKFSWTGPIIDPDYWKAAGSLCCSDCCCRCRFWSCAG